MTKPTLYVNYANHDGEKAIPQYRPASPSEIAAALDIDYEAAKQVVSAVVADQDPITDDSLVWATRAILDAALGWRTTMSDPVNIQRLAEALEMKMLHQRDHVEVPHDALEALTAAARAVLEAPTAETETCKDSHVSCTILEVRDIEPGTYAVVRLVAEDAQS